MLRQIEAIAGLPKNWDSHGASRPDGRILDAGRRLLISLCRATSMPRPHVNPTRAGGIQFEWEDESRYFEIEIVGETEANFFFRDDSAVLEVDGKLRIGGGFSDFLVSRAH